VHLQVIEHRIAPGIDIPEQMKARVVPGGQHPAQHILEVRRFFKRLSFLVFEPYIQAHRRTSQKSRSILKGANADRSKGHMKDPKQTLSLKEVFSTFFFEPS